MQRTPNCKGSDPRIWSHHKVVAQPIVAQHTPGGHAKELCMALKPPIWNGYAFTLSIRRHWNTFFGLATICDVKAPNMTKLLREGAGYHITGRHELVVGAKDYFDTFDNWWSYSCRLCDQSCDFYLMERPREGNTFAEFRSTCINDRTAFQDFAKASCGYVGPDQWKLT